MDNGKNSRNGVDNKGFTNDDGRVDLTPYEEEDEPQGCGELIRKWPKTTFAIVGNEFCERFSYYGMRTILTLYLINIAQFDDDGATAIYHGFIVLGYTSPIIGSIIADGFIGKFQTILWISLVYASGQVVLAVSAGFHKDTWLHPTIDLVGLFIIAFGTGGIKPCVAPFGADQFDIGQEKMISMYFSMFYFSINAGSTVSTFLTPLLRTVPCLGQDSCYPLAFGVPAVLMVVATAVFLSGSFWYKKMPPTENVILKVVKAIGTALRNKFFRSGRSIRRDHWLDHYCDTNPGPQAQKLANDIKAVGRVVVMFLPIPVFWTLFDQQGSRWIIQGVAMDGDIGFYTILPDQMQTLNAVLIMVFIPIFQGIIYPLVKKIGIEPTPLRKMSVGGFLAAASYFICGFVQLKVNDTLPQLPMESKAFVQFVNGIDNCNLTFNFQSQNLSVAPMMASPLSEREGGYSFDAGTMPVAWTTKGGASCPSLPETGLMLSPETNYVFYAFKDAANNPMHEYLSIVNDKIKKPQEGQGQSAFKFGYFLNDDYNGTLMFCIEDDDTHTKYPCDPQDAAGFEYIKIKNASFYADMDDLILRPGKWVLYKLHPEDDGPDPFKDGDQTINRENVRVIKTNASFEFSGQGGIYTIILQPKGVILTTLAPKNEVPLIWQIPQYIVMTASEILVSITGLDFSYSQAPVSMKSVLQAIWLLTVGTGNVIIIIIAETKFFSNLAYEMFFFAGLMVAVMIVFALLAIFYYEYTYYTRQSDDDDDQLPPNYDNVVRPTAKDEAEDRF